MTLAAKLTDKQKWQRLLSSLRYSLYVIFHPFDGFWDLSREKRGSLGAANIIVFLVCLLYTSPSPRDRSLSRMPSSA